MPAACDGGEAVKPGTVATGQRTLTLSHSSLRDWQVCPRLYELTYLRRLQMRSGCGTASQLGTCFHQALSAWHRHGRRSVAQGALRGSWPAEAEQGIAWGEKTLDAYVATYRADPDIASVLYAERSFVFDLGTVDDVLVRFAGTLDMVCRDRQGRTFLLDHKTSALGFDLWLADQRVSDQWPGYKAGAEHLTGDRIDYVVLNYINTRTSTKDPFRRATLPLSTEGVAEWREGVLQSARQMLAGFASGVWPLFRASCTRQWGRACAWYDLCVLPVDSRERFLTSCGDVRPRPAGPTEQKQPLGLATAKPAAHRSRKKA